MVRDVQPWSATVLCLPGPVLFHPRRVKTCPLWCKKPNPPAFCFKKNCVPTSRERSLLLAKVFFLYQRRDDPSCKPLPQAHCVVCGAEGADGVFCPCGCRTCEKCRRPWLLSQRRAGCVTMLLLIDSSTRVCCMMDTSLCLWWSPAPLSIL